LFLVSLHDPLEEGEIFTAVEGIGLGILGGDLFSGVGGGVFDTAQLAVLAGEDEVVCVDEDGGGCSEEDVARLGELIGLSGLLRVKGDNV